MVYTAIICLMPTTKSGRLPCLVLITEKSLVDAFLDRKRPHSKKNHKNNKNAYQIILCLEACFSASIYSGGLLMKEYA